MAKALCQMANQCHDFPIRGISHHEERRVTP